MEKKEILKTIIKEFHTKQLPDFIKREINIPVDTNKIISIVGARRAGKTYAFYQIINELLSKGVPKESIIYINFEDERLDITIGELDLILQSYRELYPTINISETYLFFDEIQNINGWEKYIRRIYDSVTKKIFITGSNSKMLSEEISTSLRGRTLTYFIYPLSFKEFLRFKKFSFVMPTDLYDSAKKAMLINLFAEYFIFGGFPEVVFLREELKTKTLQEYFNVMIFKDLVERYKIRDVFVIKCLLKRFFENIARTISINKIFNELKSQGFKISKDSLYDYTEYAKNILLISLVKRHYKSILKSELAEKKLYVIDNGLVKAVRITGEDERGILLENLIYNNLIRLENTEIRYFKEKKECDFVLENKTTNIIQVCYSISNKDTTKREILSLIEACKYFKVKNGYIITFDEKQNFTQEGTNIYVIPAYEFLLNQNI